MVSLTKAGERHHQLGRGGIHPLAHLGFPAPETIQGGGGAARSIQRESCYTPPLPNIILRNSATNLCHMRQSLVLKCSLHNVIVFSYCFPSQIHS